MENYKKLKKIGSGSQGECYLAQDTKTDKMCVIKEVDLGPLTPQEKQEAWNETRILQNLEPYPNVIDYLDAHLDAEGEKLSLVIEYADNGDLATQVLCRKSLLDEQNDGNEAARQAPPGSHRNLSDTPFFQEKHIMLVFVQCLFGLHHLHKNSIMHRDIKTHNILLFSNGLVKLGDFGVAKSFKRTKVRKSYVGSPLYMAPEIHSSKGYTYKADIWSLGCVLHELCCLKHPYTGNNVIQLAMEVTNAPPPTYLEVPPRTYAVDLLHLINRMLQKDPELRPSTAEIIRMPFVYKYSESLANRYKALHYFKQIHEEFKGTLRDLPPASPCLEAENMRGQDTAVKTVTEEELFASAEEAMPTAVIEPRHTQEQGLSRGGRLASATKPLDLQYGTYYFGSLDEGAVGTVETCAELPWKFPPTLEAQNLGKTQLADKELLIPDSPLKPANPQPNQSALPADRELLFLLDALVPDGGPASGDNLSQPRNQSSQTGDVIANAISFEKIPLLNSLAPQAACKVQDHSEYAGNQHAQDNQQGATAEARIMQPLSKAATSVPAGSPSHSRADEGVCIPTTQSQQQIYSCQVNSTKACASTFAPSEKTGQQKANRFWATLCCRGRPDRKRCKRKEKAATAELQSDVCSSVVAGAGASRSRLGKLLRMCFCRRSKG